jgi:hypothetical protein
MIQPKVKLTWQMDILSDRRVWQVEDLVEEFGSKQYVNILWNME